MTTAHTAAPLPGHCIYKITFADGSWLKAELREDETEALAEAKYHYDHPEESPVATVEKVPATDAAAIKYEALKVEANAVPAHTAKISLAVMRRLARQKHAVGFAGYGRPVVERGNWREFMLAQVLGAA